MKKTLSLILVSSFGLFAATSFGRFARPELEDVPLQRILENLSKKAEEAPDDAATNHHLARTHAMAFAKKIGDEDVVKAWQGWGKKDPLSPWFGYQPKFVPFGEVKETDDTKQDELAKAHLESAISYYRKALKANPDEQKIKLGLAWCLTQSGDNEAALPLLREVAASAWEKESKSGGTFGPILYVETAEYLAPLLDKEKDAEELADMEKKKAKLLALPRAVTPLVVPLGDRVDPNSLIDRKARVRFDLDGSGRTPEWQWITNEAAWLVYDPNKTGKITSAIQMFGSRTFLLFPSDGYEALALLDNNGDGKIDGKELDGLALWQDKNSDGVSNLEEVTPVSEHKISALSVRSQTHDSGIPYSPTGVTFGDGTTKPTYDFILESR